MRLIGMLAVVLWMAAVTLGLLIEREQLRADLASCELYIVSLDDWRLNSGGGK